MTITVLDFTNSVLKRCRVIQGDQGALATDTTSTATGATASNPLVNSAHQSEIDICLQITNEAITEVFGLGMVAPEVATATIFLVEAQREYSLPSDFEQFSGTYRSFRGATHQWTISEYPGGYEKMLLDQPGLASQWRGEAQHYALSPVSLQTIRLDFEPTSEISNWRYNILYDKRVSRSSTMATTAMPFNDTVTDSLVPVVAEGVNWVFKKDFNSDVFLRAITRAVERATQTQRRKSYGPNQTR